MKNHSIAISLSIIVICLICLGGWVANIVKIFGMAGGDVSAFFLIRLVGVVVAPLGAVLGYFS